MNRDLSPGRMGFMDEEFLGRSSSPFKRRMTVDFGGMVYVNEFVGSGSQTPGG